MDGRRRNTERECVTEREKLGVCVRERERERERRKGAVRYGSSNPAD